MITVDGREIFPLSEQQIVDQCAIIREKGLKNVSLSHISSNALATAAGDFISHFRRRTFSSVAQLEYRFPVASIPLFLDRRKLNGHLALPRSCSLGSIHL